MRLWLALALLLLRTSAAAADPLCHLPTTLNPIPSSAVSLTVGATACFLTTCTGAPATLPQNAQAALLSVETQGIRYWDDGSAPTASAGQPVGANAAFAVCGQAALQNLQLIAQSGTATVRVSWYRP